MVAKGIKTTGAILSHIFYIFFKEILHMFHFSEPPDNKYEVLLGVKTKEVLAQRAYE